MIRTLLVSNDGVRQEGGIELLSLWRDNQANWLWLDIEDSASEDSRALLESMGCNRLAISDAFRRRHPPKIEAFDEHCFLLFRGIARMDATLEVEHQQIAVWAGERFLITFHRQASISVNHIWERQSGEPSPRAPGELALMLLHYACGRYLDTLLEFEDRLGDLEDGLLSDHSEEDMKALVAYRTRLRKLRRTFSYHNDITEQALRLPQQLFPHLGEELEHVRRDVYDRCERLHSLCQMYYELCGDLVEGHISLSSHNLNQTMKVLTIISALFVPLTFIAGIYGMNFDVMPELRWPYAYFVVLGFMATLTISLLILFRRVRWL